MYKDHEINNDTQKAIDKLFDAFHDVVDRGFGVSISKNKSKSIYNSTIQILDLDKSVFAESLSNNEYFRNKRGT
tara:strand:+ start:372 stop:593 length:222 start_codon:yes stop_codon:yes gene_type:complete